MLAAWPGPWKKGASDENTHSFRSMFKSFLHHQSGQKPFCDWKPPTYYLMFTRKLFKI